MEQKILAYLKEHEAEIFADLQELVLAEASSSDIAALAHVREALIRLIKERTGAETFVYEAAGGHNPMKFEFGQGDGTVLLIGHYDTVCPIGSMELRQEGNELHGPGVLDMKSGLVSAIWSMKAYKDLGIDPGKRLRMVINGDEEIRSPESSAIICQQAEDCKAALVCEPCTSNGDLKTGRKGSIGFEITVRGKATHAGNNHKGGINAIEEMAREIQYVHSLTDYEAGTTLNVGICSGGTKANVVPDLAVFTVDCRYMKMSEGERIRKLLTELPVSVPGASREVVVDEGMPPMEQTPGNLGLYELVAECGEALGLQFSHQFVGGGSDGNKVSAMGVPTLDGMGAWGDGAHAVNEHILIDQYVPRIALLASLILKI